MSWKRPCGEELEQARRRATERALNSTAIPLDSRARVTDGARTVVIGFPDWGDSVALDDYADAWAVRYDRAAVVLVAPLWALGAVILGAASWGISRTGVQVVPEVPDTVDVGAALWEPRGDGPMSVLAEALATGSLLAAGSPLAAAACRGDGGQAAGQPGRTGDGA